MTPTPEERAQQLIDRYEERQTLSFYSSLEDEIADAIRAAEREAKREAYEKAAKQTECDPPCQRPTYCEGCNIAESIRALAKEELGE